MKNALSILLLSLFIFYQIGYRLLFMGLQYQADIEMRKVLEQQTYDVEKTITLKIPVSLPYQMFAEGFQPMQGEFEYNGEFYNLIKQKISNDTLHVVCMENELKSGINTQKTLFEKVTIDWPDASKKAYNLLISFTKDFLQNSKNEVGALNTWMTKSSFLSPIFNTLEGIGSTDTPPPKHTVPSGFLYLTAC